MSKIFVTYYEIQYLKSISWSLVDVTPNWEINGYESETYLNGNTYFFCNDEKIKEGYGYSVLILQHRDLDLIFLCRFTWF